MTLLNKQIKIVLNFLKRSPDFLAKRILLTFLGLFLLFLIIAGVVFYKYNFLIRKVAGQGSESAVQFNEKNYQKVLQAWQERAKKFEAADSKSYPDLFK